MLHIWAFHCHYYYSKPSDLGIFHNKRKDYLHINRANSSIPENKTSWVECFQCQSFSYGNACFIGHTWINYSSRKVRCVICSVWWPIIIDMYDELFCIYSIVKKEYFVLSIVWLMILNWYPILCVIMTSFNTCRKSSYRLSYHHRPGYKRLRPPFISSPARL